MRIGFTILGSPRTKKTSNRVVPVGHFHRVLPSLAFVEWFNSSMRSVPIITSKLQAAGVSLPILGDVHVKAMFYRDADRGDLLGYEQALADFLQAPRYRGAKRVRDGAGIIDDDRQIISWDGTRMGKDAASPRIEVEVTLIGPEPGKLEFTEEVALA
jgi:hypothetical protein